MLDHTLIVGTTGSGKSYLEGMMIRRMLAGDGTTLVLVDPKRTELWEWADDPRTVAYSDTPQGHYDAIVRAYDQMNMRFGRMRRERAREYGGAPLCVFVDEAGALMNDRRHRRAYVEMLGNIAMMGRAARVFLVWATQVPTRQNVPNEVRDNFPNKVVLRLDVMGRARYVFGCEPEGGFAQLPRYGEGYVRTPDMLEGPRRMAVGDGMLGALGM